MGMTRDEYQTIIDNTNQASVNVAMQRDITIADCFEGLTEQHPDKCFLIFEDHHFSYADINNSANNYAKVLLKAGVTKGDSVALMMENRVEFFYAWLGILKIGAVAALINTEAKTKAVSHAVTTVDSRFAFVGIECYPRYATGDERLFKIPVVVRQVCKTPYYWCSWANPFCWGLCNQFHKEQISGQCGVDDDSMPFFYTDWSKPTPIQKKQN